MYDIPIKQKKSTKLTLKEEENRLELIKKENVDKIHDILINSKNLYEDLSILYPNLKGNRHLMMARTINDLYRNKSLQNILFGEEFDNLIDLKDNLFKKIVATGGNITEIIDNNQRYRVHTFTNSGNFEVVNGGDIEILMVGGGGAGGNGMGAGGGAGGVIHHHLKIEKDFYPIIIGSGGAGTLSDIRVNGNNTTFNSLTAYGGGGGNSLSQDRNANIIRGADGGSGGGSGGLDSARVTATTAAQRAGGAPIQVSFGFGSKGGDCNAGGTNYPGAGGGGALQDGESITSASMTKGGKGGNGYPCDINGTYLYWGGGGGGNNYLTTGVTGGAGGLGGGGGGSVRGGTGGAGGGSALNTGGSGYATANTRGGHGGANTGGGGGGASWSAAPGGNGGSGIVIIRYPIDNNPDNHIVNSYTDIIGVQDDGTRSSNGAGLRQVIFNNSKLDLTTKDTAYFDNHRSYRFSDYYDNTGNAFVKIPISYWWRGMLPDVIDGTTPRWTMLLSPYPITKTINGVNCTFTASPSTFNHNTKGWLPHFYIGKYRGHNAGDNKVGSKAGQTFWGNVSFDNFRTYCSNNGADYHMLSLFEWHEILARMVIEKCTFQLIPKATRATQASCVYRGINDFAYGPTSGVRVEWMDGIRTDASGNFEMWSTADGNYISTGKNCIVYTGESDYYCQSLYSEMDNLFISATNGANATSFIPDLAGMRVSGLVSKVCVVYFTSSNVYCGAFYARFNNSSTDADTVIGCRLSKW